MVRGLYTSPPEATHCGGNRLHRSAAAKFLNKTITTGPWRWGEGWDVVSRVATIHYLKCPVFNKNKDTCK